MKNNYEYHETATHETVREWLLTDEEGLVIENDETWRSVKIVTMLGIFKHCYECRVRDIYSNIIVVYKTTSDIKSAVEWLMN